MILNSLLRSLSSCNSKAVSAKKCCLEVEPLEGRDLMSGMGLLVPAYIYPENNSWAPLAQAATQVPVMAIMNPNNGPGYSTDQYYAETKAAYTSAVSSLHAATGKVIGYVATTDGNRDINSVKRDIDAYRTNYVVDGIFIDEMSNSYTTNATKAAYYKEIYDYIHGPNPAWTVVGNPGSLAPESYLTPTTKVADMLVLYESDQAQEPNNLFSNYNAPSFQANYPATRFANLPINIPTAAQMQSAVAKAASQNTGWIYVTDDHLGTPDRNPWDTLPSYWNQLVSTVAASTPTASQPLAINGSLPTGTVGAGYNQTLTVSGGVAPYTALTVSGFNAGGTGLLTPVANPTSRTISVSGAPTGPGTLSFTVNVRDSVGSILSRSFSLAVNAAPLTISTTSLPAGIANQAGYSQAIAVTGGTGAKTFLKSAGTLPVGLTLNSTNGLISGTPMTAGTYSFTIRATDAVGANASKAFSIVINPPSTVAPLAPTNFTVTAVSGSQINLAWSDVANETGYRIHKWNGAIASWQVVATLAANATSIVCTGLSAGTTYFFDVEAYNSVGGVKAGWKAATTWSPPAAPTTLTLTTVSASQVNLTWSNVENESGYRVQIWNGVTASWQVIATLAANVTSFSSYGLSSRTTYFYRVEAFNTVGSSLTDYKTATTL